MQELALQNTGNEGVFLCRSSYESGKESGEPFTMSSFPVKYSPVQNTVNEGGVLTVHVGVAMSQEKRTVSDSPRAPPQCKIPHCKILEKEG